MKKRLILALMIPILFSVGPTFSQIATSCIPSANQPWCQQGQRIRLSVDTDRVLNIPDMTTTQRDAITAENGDLIYNTTVPEFQRYEDGAWGAFGGGSGTITGSGTTGTIAKFTGSTAIGDSLLIEGTNLIEQRNGTNIQTSNLYKTFTDASNYERLSIIALTNEFRVETQFAGTGTAKALFLSASGASSIAFRINGLNRWNIDSSGHLLTVADNVYDIGEVGLGPRTIYLRTSLIDPLIIGGSGTTQTLTLRSTSGVGATGADLIFQVGNNGGTEAMRILNNANVGIGDPTPEVLLDVEGGTFTVADSSNVASTTTTALTVGNLFHITGTTTITTLNTCDSGNNGRLVTLIFDGVLTFTDGNNHVLAGDFVTTANDVIQLACDGTNWYEISRSVN